MAKSLRSKVKRKFRTELRQRIGVPHQAKQEAKIQENLKKAIAAQTSGNSVLGLKQLMGSSAAPVAVADAMDVDTSAGSLAQKEAELLNDEDGKLAAADKKKKKQKKPATKRKKKFLQFHVLRKKGQ